MRPQLNLFEFGRIAFAHCCLPVLFNIFSTRSSACRRNSSCMAAKCRSSPLSMAPAAIEPLICAVRNAERGLRKWQRVFLVLGIDDLAAAGIPALAAWLAAQLSRTKSLSLTCNRDFDFLQRQLHVVQ